MFKRQVKPRAKLAKSPRRVVLVHEFTKEIAVALVIPRGRKTIIEWDGRQEEPDELGYIAGGWKMTEGNPEFSSVPKGKYKEEAEFIDIEEFINFEDGNDDS